jgi:hypothetical protein
MKTMLAVMTIVTSVFFACDSTEQTDPGATDTQADACQPQCVDHGGTYGACGPDGCGGICGDCTGADECVFRDGPYYGECRPGCDQLCELNGYECGDLYSGSDCFCGLCDEGLVCAGTGYENPDMYSFGWETRQTCRPVEGLCVGTEVGLSPIYFACTETETCVESGCASGECGADAGCGALGCCGYDCLKCDGPQQTCLGGECTCTPACEAKECGDDGCGGACGECPDSTNCDESGTCVPE